MLSRAASTSLELDSHGSSDSSVMRDRAISSAITCRTDAWLPRAPNRSSPCSASSAAFAIPIELAFSSGAPLLILLPRSQMP